MKKYKYMRTLRNRSMTDYELNEFGSRGWSLVSVVYDNNNYEYIFKIECEYESCSDGTIGLRVGNTVATSIKELYGSGAISRRLYTALYAHGVDSVAELVKNEELLAQFSAMRNFGKKTKDEMADLIAMIKDNKI